MEMPRDDGWINLYTTDTLLRYKSEWDPRLHAHTKGGYLDGEIRVPKVEQGNYSLRRPPKLIIPQIFIEQRWTTVYRFMCKKICISNKANMTRALMRVQFWVNSQYSPRTEPTEQPIFTQN